MTAPYQPLKQSILQRLAGQLFPGLGADGEGAIRQGLLQLGANLLQAGGRSPNQPGTLANIGAAIGGVDIQGLTQRAMQMRAYQQQQAAQQQVAEITARHAPAAGASPEDIYNSVAAMIPELLKVQGTEDYVGRLSNVLAQLRPPREQRDDWALQAGTVDPKTGQPVLQGGVPGLVRVNRQTGEVRPVGLGVASGAGTTDFTRANILHGRWLQETKNHRDVALNYDAVLSAGSDPSPAGDLSLIFAYMKMLDPGSVVREGEFATAANTGSVPERVRAQYNKVLSGERLTEAQRADFLKQAHNRADGVHQSLLRARSEYGKRARKFGLDVDDVSDDYFAGLKESHNRAPQAGAAKPSDFPEFDK